MELQLETVAISSLGDGVMHVELNRPKKMNAMNHQFWKDCKAAFDALAADGDCRVILLSGRGKGFSAGLDIMDPLNQPPHAEDAARRGFKFMDHVQPMQGAVTALEKSIKPVIAVVHGVCVGAGVDLITAADVRICTEDAKFCIKEAALGLAADVGTLARLPKIVGNDSVVRELALTARNFDAAEARSMGLVSTVAPTQEAAMAEAQRVAGLIAANSPVGVVGTKRNLNYARDHSVQESLDYVSTWNAAMIQTDDLGKAISASMSKTRAEYSKL